MNRPIKDPTITISGSGRESKILSCRSAGGTLEVPRGWSERGFGGHSRVSALPKALTSEGLAIRNRRVISVLVWAYPKFVGCYHNSHPSTFSLTRRSSKARTHRAPGLRPSRSCVFFLIACGSTAFDAIYPGRYPTGSRCLQWEALLAVLDGRAIRPSILMWLEL